MNHELKDKIVLITGSSRGIGAAIAKKLSREGAIVVIHHMKDHSNAKKVLNYVRNYSKKSMVYSCDVRNYDDVNQMAKKITETFGTLDILINNAGITKDHSLKNMDIDSEWQDVISTNLNGVMHCCKAFLPSISKNSGKIINISSIVGILGNFGQSAYAASKAGVIGLTRSLAKECAPNGIAVNAVLPGFIETSMLKKIPNAKLEIIKSNIPFNRFGKVEDVAGMVYFLCSKECSYVTGQIFVIDGGISINSI